MATIQHIHIGDRVRVSREISLSRPATLAEAISRKGIDERHQVRLLNRRAHYAQSQDRTKFWATDKTTSIYAGYWTRGICYTADHASRDLETLRTTTDTSTYVSAWCRLNNLKE